MNVQKAVARLIDAIEEDLSGSRPFEKVVHKMPRPAGAAVYTAFDGDHFCLTSVMAQHAARRGHIAISPEACLGYKTAVDVLKIKRNVLYHDVSLLAKADEVWVYTTEDPDSFDWRDLAEGVAIELAWYVFRCKREQSVPRIFFVDACGMALGNDPDPRPISVDSDTFEYQIRAVIPEACNVADRFYRSGSAPVAVPIFALQDAKNGPWVRQWLISEECAPIVPTIAFEPISRDGIQRLAEGWVWSLRHADRIVMFRQMNGDRSVLLTYLESFCRSLDREVETVAWSRVQAPKALQGSEWPITTREKRQLLGELSECGASYYHEQKAQIEELAQL